MLERLLAAQESNCQSNTSVRKVAWWSEKISISTEEEEFEVQKFLALAMEKNQ